MRPTVHTGKAQSTPGLNPMHIFWWLSEQQLGWCSYNLRMEESDRSGCVAAHCQSTYSEKNPIEYHIRNEFIQLGNSIFYIAW